LEQEAQVLEDGTVKNKLIDYGHSRSCLVGSHAAKRAAVGLSRPGEISQSSSLPAGAHVPQFRACIGSIAHWFLLARSEYDSVNFRCLDENAGCSHETIIGVVHAVLKHHTYSKLQRRSDVAH